MSAINFDINELPVSQNNFDPLPPGWYTVTIKDAKLTDTKDRSGQYIAVQYATKSNRVVFGNLNIRNKNPKAEEIGRQQLGELMRAVGLTRVTDTDQLIGGTLQIKLAIREAANGYEASNDVKGYKAIEGGMMPSASPAAAPAPAKAAPPWAKK
jgi:Protein of unknown function (DUF669)